MGAPKKVLTITYQDIIRITGKNKDAVYGDASRDDREGFDFKDVESVLLYCAKWAPFTFKARLFEVMCAPSGGDTRRQKK